MGNKGGLPSVPRGLDQELTLYLQALDGLVRRMAGMVRGSVQESSAARSTAATQHASASSTEGASAIGCVTTRMLADGAVGTKQLKRRAVTTDILADKAVTEAKLADGLLPEWLEGTAQDGDEIILGAWAGRPALCVTGFELPSGMAGRLSVGLDNLRHDGSVWRCTARAVCNEERGLVHWLLVGKKA